MKHYTEETTLMYNLEVDVTEFISTDTRTEECHGFHTFEDTHVSHRVDRVYITLDSKEEIDLTDRLTDKEKDMLYNYQQ